jgi:outer membrane usher protein
MHYRIMNDNYSGVLSRSILACSCRYVFITSILMMSFPVISAATFDPHALELNGPEVSVPDLAVFNDGGQLPGDYRVDVYVNNIFFATRDIHFITGKNGLKPQLSANEWGDFGINKSAFPSFAALPQESLINDMAEYVPDVTANLDFNRMRLNISLPQAALTPLARQSVDPSRWDSGITTAFVNYSITAAGSGIHNLSGDNRDLFVGLSPGFNMGPWRLRNYTTFVQNNESGTEESNLHGKQSHWASAYTYLQRDIQLLRSQLTLGETSSAGDVFAPFRFLGVQLATDDSMLPDSMRGFAPVVRGIAASNAQVTIRQNGNVIYQTYVAPGAFAIRDLYPTASSGNLDITVREADGSERSFVQPFSAVPGMQREGQLRYSASAGRYRSNGGGRTPEFVQSTVQYGVGNTSTLYGGALVAENYQSGSLGVGQNLGVIGSLSLDVTHANSHLRASNNLTSKGQSYRLQYAKDVFQSGTTFTLAGYRYSTSGYYDFEEANEMLPNTGRWDERNWTRLYNKRSRMQAQVSQNLGRYGSLYISAYQQDYWRLNGKERTISSGYSTNVRGINYGINYAETQAPGSMKNRQIAFSVQIPLSDWLPGTSASYNVSADQRRVQNQAGISGTALEDNSLNYNLSQGFTSGNEGAQGSAAASYKGSYGNVRGSYSYSDYGLQLNVGVEGSIVAHPYGITLAQPLGTTSALVRAPGTAGAKVQNKNGVSTDWRGYTVVPYLSPYRENRIALSPDSLPENVDLDNPVKTLIPTQGAVVLADFKPRIGNRVLLTLMFGNKPVPFGATATLSNETDDITSGIVGESGELYLNGVPRDSTLLVSWGKGSQQRCSLPLTLPQKPSDVLILNLSAVCR